MWENINEGISTKSFACGQIETSTYILKNEFSLIPCFSQSVRLPHPTTKYLFVKH